MNRKLVDSWRAGPLYTYSWNHLSLQQKPKKRTLNFSKLTSTISIPLNGDFIKSTHQVKYIHLEMYSHMAMLKQFPFWNPFNLGIQHFLSQRISWQQCWSKEPIPKAEIVQALQPMGWVSFINQSSTSFFPCSFRAGPITSRHFWWYSFTHSI